MHVMEDLVQFVGTDKNKYYYVNPVKNHMMVWKELRDGNGEFICDKLNLSVVNEQILTDAGLWETLPNKIKELIVKTHESTKAERIERMAHARTKRKKKFDFSNLPEFLTCKCGKEVKANYYYLQKKADEKKVPLDDLVKSYQCKACNPVRRGRKASQDYNGIPDKLVCKCGHEVKYHPSMILKMAEKKGKTVDELVKGYICRACKKKK